MTKDIEDGKALKEYFIWTLRNLYKSHDKNILVESLKDAFKQSRE